MRFQGERQVQAPATHVWAALHDPRVLRDIITGCEDMRPLAVDVYAATLAARVGPMADTYRGTFSITDIRASSDLRVRVEAKGRCGRLSVDLRVRLLDTPGHRSTTLRYDAEATVGGLVSRLGRAALTVAGGHFTGCFFRDLDRAVRHEVSVGAPSLAV
jgi:carbon monoxide dehydrogenase subunit G